MVSANFAGDYEPQGAIIINGKKTGSAITKGDVCNLSSGSWQTAPTSGNGPFAVCIRSAAASDAKVSLIIKGIVYVVADGVIVPFNPVVVSAATAGQVQQTATPVAANCVGKYLRHENEGDLTTVETNAADADVIAIELGGPF